MTANDSTTTDYWQESSSPLTSLIFVTPILLVYELGVVILGTSALRNGAEQWLRQLLEWTGLGQYFLLPILTCGLLLGWQHIRQQPWRFSRLTLQGMISETFVLATGLICFAYFQSYIFWSLDLSIPSPPTCSMDVGSAARIIGYCGAGFYEEVLFRLMLIPLLACILKQLGESERGCIWGAAVGASLIFSAAHYEIFSHVGDRFLWSTFSFRFVAGMVFSFLFLKRGFGITAGAHTLYDIYIAVLNG